MRVGPYRLYIGVVCELKEVFIGDVVFFYGQKVILCIRLNKSCKDV